MLWQAVECGISQTPEAAIIIGEFVTITQSEELSHNKIAKVLDLHVRNTIRKDVCLTSVSFSETAISIDSRLLI